MHDGAGGRSYFLSRATKSTKKRPKRNQCRADGGKRLEPRGDCTVESISSFRLVLGASSSLREDDAGPYDMRRCVKSIHAASPGPGFAGTPPGGGARAGEFISPSEYQMKGVPAEIQRSDFSGERRRGGSADPKQ